MRPMEDPLTPSLWVREACWSKLDGVSNRIALGDFSHGRNRGAGLSYEIVAYHLFLFLDLIS